MSAVVLVCARGGSRGIPWKNFKSPYEGKNPYQILREKLECTPLNKLRSIICSDSDEILELAGDSGFECCKRPASLATSSSRLVEVLKFVKNSFSLGDNCQVVQISAVAPFITPSTIEKVYTLGSVPNSSVISVTKFEGNAHPALAGRVELSSFKFAFQFPARYPRQSREPMYYPNGCIFSRWSSMIKGDTITNDLPSSPLAVVMPHSESLNLDDMNDWHHAISLANN